MCPVDVAFLYEKAAGNLSLQHFQSSPIMSGVQTFYYKNHNQFQIISHQNTDFLRSAAVCWYVLLSVQSILQDRLLWLLDQILYSICGEVKDFNSVKKMKSGLLILQPFKVMMA